jgi:hypothetical protein
MAQAFIRDVYFPHFLVMMLGTLTLLSMTLWEAARRGVRTIAPCIMRSPILPVAIFAAEAILALTTTSNKGSGFFAPVVPALIVLTAWAFARIDWARTALSALVAAVAIVSVVPLIDLHTPFAPEWVLEVPLLGGVTVTDGRGTIQRDEARAGYGAHNAVEPINDTTSRAWVALSVQTVVALMREAGPQGIVAFAFRNELYNVNTVNLQALLAAQSAFGARMIDPVVTGDTVGGYLDWLRRDAADACALLTSDRIGGDFAPAINRTFMEEAARKAGFVQEQTWSAPDGQNIVLWKHGVAPPNCK